MVAEARKRRKVSKEVVEKRSVVHPEPKVELRIGKLALTSDEAKELLGWEAETDEVAFAEDYICKDFFGVKIRCRNNEHNRPLNESWAKSIASDILDQHWQFNGETIIISETGQVLSGQHRLLGFIMACQKWASEKDSWPKWEDEPTLDVAICYGVSDEGEVTRTLDNVRPRSLADVLFCSGYFEKQDRKSRDHMCKVLDHAVRFLWHRTAADVSDPWSPKRTHSESLDFINRHKKIIEFVDFICRNDGDKAISKWINPGIAAGLLYLMAASNTDPEKYLEMDSPSEGTAKKPIVDFSKQEKAEEFWVKFSSMASKDNPIAGLRDALAYLTDPGCKSTGSLAEKLAFIVNAWLLFEDGETVTKKSISPKYRENDDGVYVLDESPTCGGIDAFEMVQERMEAEKEAERERRKAERKAAKDAEGEGDESEDQEDDDDSLVDEDDDEGMTADDDDGLYGNVEKEYAPTPEEIEKEKESIRRKKGH